MKILKSCGSRSYGGIEKYILKTIVELLRLGNDVSLICPDNSKILQQAKRLNIKTYPILEQSIKRINSIIQLRNHFQNHDYDIIHTHLSNDLWIIVPAMKLSSVKSKLILSKCMASGINKRDVFHKYLYSNVDVVIAVSEFIKNNLLETCPVKEPGIIVIPDAVSVNEFNPGAYNKNIIRSELGFSCSDIVVGLIGRMSPGKGHEIFFECVRIISAVNKNVKFIVVGAASYGEEEYEKKLMKLAENTGIRNKILFTGYQENIPYYLSAIDILAFPSHQESFGGTVLEAMAMEVPVVAFASGGVKEIIINNFTGVLVENFSVDSFCDALISLIENKDLRKIYGENSRRVVSEKFEINSNMLMFNELYKRLINEKK